MSNKRTTYWQGLGWGCAFVFGVVGIVVCTLWGAYAFVFGGGWY